jgi:O-antigen/teichoic acid export membrane protein
MLHLAEASWMAAATSLVQASGATVALIILGRAVGDPAWVAFGALGAANVVSVSFGLWIARRNAAGTKVPAEVHATVHHSLRYREVVRGGRYLALTGVMSAGTNLLVTWLVSTIAGASTVGYAEAARTIAQPVMVVAMGLRSVMGPASMDAGRRGDRQAGSRVAWTFYAALGALSLVYAVAVGPAWSFSPLPGLVSLAYVVGWTVAITILANVLNGAAFPRRLELVGAGRERSLLMSEAWANAAQLATAAVLATAFGGSVLVATLARPGSMVALGVTRIGLYRVPLDHHYDREPVPTT